MSVTTRSAPEKLVLLLAWLLALLLGLPLTGSPVAFAQEAMDPTSASPEAPEEDDDEEEDDDSEEDDEEGLEVITVTAQKRTQDVQDVPSSITVLDSETYGTFQAGGGDIRLLSARVPSLIIESSFGRSFPRMYIRGLGNTDFDLNASQPVNLVVDEVVLENPIVKSFPIFDIERVEVLRGPQGTLFGRNTPAGVVKIDTAKPTDEVSAYARFNYGSFNFTSFEGAVSGPVFEDVLTARASVLFQRRDDWVDNTLTEADADLEGFTQGAARFQLHFTPTEDLSLLLNAHAHSQEASARVFRANAIASGSAEPSAFYDRFEVQQDGENGQSLDQWGVTAHLGYDLELVELTAVYGFERASIFGRGDIDGGFGAAFLMDEALFGPGFIPFPSETADAIPQVDQHTVEVRLATDDFDYVNGQVGFFYFDEDLSIESYSYDTLAGGVQNGFASQRQQANALAVFGTVMVEPIDALHIQGGVRYTNDEKEFEAARTQSPVGADPIGPLTTETSADFVSWDASVTYDVAEEVSVYGKVAQGYRAPSIQGRVLFGDALSVADTESVLSFELGTKTRFLSNRAQINLTGFYYRIQDQQLTAVGGETNFNTLLNADEGVGYGAELDASFLPVDNLQVGFAGSYNYTEIQDENLAIAPCGAGCTVLDPVVNAEAGTVSIDGNPLPHAPQWIFNANLTYLLDVFDLGDIYFNTDLAYRSEVSFFLYQSEEFRSPDLLEVGARVGFKKYDGMVDLALYARNLFDNDTFTGGIDFNNLTGFVNEPRVLGVEGTFRF